MGILFCPCVCQCVCVCFFPCLICDVRNGSVPAEKSQVLGSHGHHFPAGMHWLLGSAHRLVDDQLAHKIRLCVPKGPNHRLTILPLLHCQACRHPSAGSRTGEFLFGFALTANGPSEVRQSS